MRSMLEVKGISVVAKDKARLLSEINLRVAPGEAVGLTGKSGAGKTTLIKSLMGILDHRHRLTQGSISLDGVELAALRAKARWERCGTLLGFIPQNPMTAFDSRVKIEKQMVETFRLRLRKSKEEARALARETLLAVNLRDISRVLDSFPGQLSGGMLQRVSVAFLLGMKPRYILADEPTSALDAANREMLLELLAAQLAGAGILLISHDVDALRSLCSTVHVLEEGRITESGTMDALLTAPLRPWTMEFAAAYQKQCEGESAWESC